MPRPCPLQQLQAPLRSPTCANNTRAGTLCELWSQHILVEDHHGFFPTFVSIHNHWSRHPGAAGLKRIKSLLRFLRKRARAHNKRPTFSLLIPSHSHAHTYVQGADKVLGFVMAISFLFFCIFFMLNIFFAILMLTYDEITRYKAPLLPMCLCLDQVSMPLHVRVTAAHWKSFYRQRFNDG